MHKQRQLQLQIFLLSAKDNRPSAGLPPYLATSQIYNTCRLWIAKKQQGTSKDNVKSTNKGRARIAHLSTNQMCIRTVIKTRRDRNKDKASKDNHNKPPSLLKSTFWLPTIRRKDLSNERLNKCQRQPRPQIYLLLLSVGILDFLVFPFHSFSLSPIQNEK